MESIVKNISSIVKIIVLAVVAVTALIGFVIPFFKYEVKVNRCVDRVLAYGLYGAKTERRAEALCKVKYDDKSCNTMKTFFDEECDQEQKNQ